MTIGTAARAAPLTDAIIIAVSRLVDDAQVDRRDPSHADLKFLFQQVGLADADLTTPAGKERRVRQVLSWAVEHDPDRGERLVARLIAAIKGSGGFRPGSANYVGEDAINTAHATFAAEGFELTEDGDLQPVLLQGLDDPATPIVLRSYVRRASRGAADAALVVGTGRICLRRLRRTYSSQGMAPMARGPISPLCSARPSRPLDWPRPRIAGSRANRRGEMLSVGCSRPDAQSTGFGTRREPATADPSRPTSRRLKPERRFRRWGPSPGSSWRGQRSQARNRAAKYEHLPTPTSAMSPRSPRRGHRLAWPAACLRVCGFGSE